MNGDFFPGMVVGILLGVLATMIGLAIFSRFSTSKKVEEEKQHDPADWWKRGEPPPC